MLQEEQFKTEQELWEENQVRHPRADGVSSCLSCAGMSAD
jgi:hypothetical protein